MLWTGDSLLVELGFRIPVVNGIPGSLSCIPDFKAQDSGIHIPAKISRIPESGLPCMGQDIILTSFPQSYLLRFGGIYPPEFSPTLHSLVAFWKIKPRYSSRLPPRFTTLTRLSTDSSVSRIKFLSITSDLNLAHVCSFPCQFYGLISWHKVATIPGSP